jgi:5-methylthioadenosine/S-adenosylhomocysteine deaminase
MKADLVVFDYRRPHLVPAQDPLGNLVHTAQGRDVAMVFVDGRLVAQNGRPTLVDLDEVMADAQRIIKKLWRQAA